jgi:hypothetical protein
METAAIIAVVLLASLMVFQVALAAGAPLGAAAWGGRHAGVLPASLRIASGVAAVVLYPAIILLVLVSSGLVATDWLPGAGTTAMWLVTAFFAIGTLANLASRSRTERFWAPVSLALAICCAIVARSL